MKLKCNCCDGIYNSFDVHFTSLCDNNCKHCIDKTCEGLKIDKPNVSAIVETVVKNQENVSDVLFLGGEPCLWLDELIECVTKIKELTNLKIYVTTSVPKNCFDNKDKFIKLIELVEGLNISAQHYNEKIADEIRGTISKFDRKAFYSSLPLKEKIRINLNIVYPFLCTKEEILKCLDYFDKMAFNSIKLSELQHSSKYYKSFENIFNIKLPSPFSNGCQTYINDYFPNIKTPILLKRSCFLCEDTLKANFSDGVKAFLKLFINKANKWGVIYENGLLKKGWV